MSSLHIQFLICNRRILPAARRRNSLIDFTRPPGTWLVFVYRGAGLQHRVNDAPGLFHIILAGKQGGIPRHGIAEHPLGPFLRAGFSVGVNTDNRLMSAVGPASELRTVAESFDLTWAEIERLVVNAVEAGFAPYEERRRIVDEVVRPAYAALGAAEM